jgi:hypothetical protein
MPPKRGGATAKPPAGATKSKYAKSSLSPTRGEKSPKKGRGEEEGKDMATLLEEERKRAQKALRKFAEETLEGLSLGNIDVDMTCREGVETLCRDYMQWLDVSEGANAKADEYNIKLGALKASLERALELTKIKRQEPPLPLNIFEGDAIIITDRERQVESAIKNGNAAELDRLLSLQRGRALLNNRDEAGWTSLHHAVAGGQKELVSVVLRQGADVNQENNEGWTPTHLACAHGRTSVLPLLITAGAQLDIITRQPPEWTPLHFAAANGELDAVELLIKAKADTVSKDEGGWTPLHLAAMNGHTNVAVALMWGNKEEMQNGADNGLGLTTVTGGPDAFGTTGPETVSGLIASLVASCHLEVKTQAQITAAMLRVKDENTRRAMEAKNKRGKKGTPGASPLSTAGGNRTPLATAAGKGKDTTKTKDNDKDGVARKEKAEKDPKARSKSPPHGKSPPRSKSPARPPKP